MLSGKKFKAVWLKFQGLSVFFNLYRTALFFLYDDAFPLEDVVAEKQLFPQAFTRFYTLFYPQKKHSHLHMERVSVRFSAVLSVKDWIFKYSPPLWRFYPFIC
ncbi:hypothetical protein MR642_01330 [bacterium]|nr:hypothetical protein [bacterium]